MAVYVCASARDVLLIGNATLRCAFLSADPDTASTTATSSAS